MDLFLLMCSSGCKGVFDIVGRCWSGHDKKVSKK
jgi:hypothetical protein